MTAERTAARQHRVARRVAIIIVVTVAVLAVTLMWGPRLLGGHSSTVLTDSMDPAIRPGDVTITLPVNTDDIQEGDVIMFTHRNADMTITHRVVEITDDTLITKGDNARIRDVPVRPDQVLGRVAVVVPFLGLPILWVGGGVNLAILGLLVLVGVGAVTFVQRLRRR